MTAQPGSLAEVSLTLGEFARYVNRNVVTVRKWFEHDPKVVRVPRGNQRAQILIPTSHALERGKEMGIPDNVLQRMIANHSLQFGVQPPIKASGFPPVTPATPKRGVGKSPKSAKAKKRR